MSHADDADDDGGADLALGRGAGSSVELPRLSERTHEYAAASVSSGASPRLGLHAPPRIAGDPTLARAPSPLSAHSSNAESGGGGGGHHGSSSSRHHLSPSSLLKPFPLLLLSCWLVALGTSNAIVGFGGLGGHECAELGGLLLWTSLACFVTLPALQLLAHATNEERQQQAARNAAAVAAGRDPDTVAAAAAGNTGRSLSSTVRWSLLALLLISVPSALGGISWLADGRCQRRRSVRQLALVDIIVILSVLVLLAIYYVLGKLPSRYARQLSRSGGKTLALVLCLSALIANIAQVQTHDEEWAESYHWSFTVRDPPCTHSCLAAAQSSSVRSIVCRDSSGEVVETPHCFGSGSRASAAFHPTAQVSMLKECPSLRMGKCKNEFAELFGNATLIEAGQILLQMQNQTATQQQQSPVAPMPASEVKDDVAQDYVPQITTPTVPLVVFPANSVLNAAAVQARRDPECPLECVNYPSDYKYPGSLDLLSIPLGCWQETEYLRQLASGFRVPTGWVTLAQCEENEQFAVNTAVCPPRPCPAYCGPLESASIVYATVYSVAIALLLVALFRKRLVRTACFRRMQAALGGHYDPAAAELEQTIRVPPAVMGMAPPAPRFTVDDENDMPAGSSAHQYHMSATGVVIGGSDSAVAASLPAAPASGSNDLPSVWHSLRLAVRALCLCSRSSEEGGLSCRDLRPWWKHLLFLAGVLFLLGLLFYELSNLFWLTEAHCRDFLVSTLLNFLLTLLAALLLGALILRQRHRIVVQDSNPFELAGLLDQQGQEDLSSRGGGGAAIPGGDDDEEDDDDEALEAEFGLASPSSAAEAVAAAAMTSNSSSRISSSATNAEAHARSSLEAEPAATL